VFVHAVLEGLAAIDEDDGDFVGELAAQLLVTVHVNFLPGKASAPMQLVQAFFDDLAEMTPFARIEDDLPGLRHGASVARSEDREFKLTGARFVET